MASKRLSPARFFVTVAIVVVLYVCRAAFIPLALALLVSLLLSGLIERLHTKGISRGVSAFAVLALLIGIFGGALNLLWSPAQQWYQSAPETLRVIRSKVRPVALVLQHLEELSAASDSIAASGAQKSSAAVKVAEQQDGAESVFKAARSILAGAIACVVATLFLLTGGPPMVARMTVALVDDLHALHVMELIDQVRAAVGQFYLTTALLNLALGGATAAVMSALGMPSPLLWGALAAVLTFIPYAGSGMVVVIITVVALVSFDSPARILMVIASYLAIATVGGQIIQPLLVGQRMEINPLVVFLSLWFGVLFWGVAGMVLAMPSLLALKVIAQNSRGGNRLRAFLGPNEAALQSSPVAEWLTEHEDLSEPAHALDKSL